MVRKFSFMEAAPLIDFIEKHKERIIGKSIVGFFSTVSFGSYSDEPLAFEFGEFVLVLHYFFYSDLTMHIIPPEQFHSDETLNFLYENIPGSRNLCHYIRKNKFPYAGCKIVDVSVERFSHEFEINASTGETRPDGGDYFKTITVHLEGGKCFHICALDAEADGYVRTWD